MKLPKFSAILAGIGKTLVRFPLAFLCSEIAAAALILIMDHVGPSTPSLLFPVLFSALSGIALFTALSVSAEYRRWGTIPVLIVNILAINALGAYAATVPKLMDSAPLLHLYRLQLILIAVHAMVASLPFLFRKDSDPAIIISESWSFNIQLAGRVILGLLGSFALWMGLALALAAFDNLFGIHLRSIRYGELLVLVLGTFNTLFVLGGVPQKNELLTGTVEGAPSHVPKVLRMFTFYVLVPLVLVYIIILYAYFVKMLVTWRWLDGWVAPLVMGFAGVGILALILIDPMRRGDEPKWVRKFSLAYMLSLIPAAVLLISAIHKRTDMYGLTEMRIVGFVVGVWILMVVLYGTLSKSKAIVVVPASLGLLALMVGFGPWSMFTLSERSQTFQLRKLLEEQHMFVNGKVVDASAPLDRGTHSHLQSILEYIGRNHGYQNIQPWFDSPLTVDTGGHSVNKPPSEIVEEMDNSLTTSSSARNLHVFLRDNSKSFTLSGYDRCTEFISAGVDENDEEYGSDAEGKGQNADLAWRIPRDCKSLIVARRGSKDSVVIPLSEFYKRIPISDSNQLHGIVVLEPEVLTYDVPNELGGLRFCFSRIQLNIDQDKRPTNKNINPEGIAVSILYKIH